MDQVSGRVPRRELEKQKQEMKRLRYRNAAYVLFLTVAFAVTSVMLISYIRMESSITQSVKQVAALQSQLNNLKTENDEMKNRIDSSINPLEIRAVIRLGRVGTVDVGADHGDTVLLGVVLAIAQLSFNGRFSLAVR